MAVTYTCTNPDCRAALKTANPVPAGKRVKCPKCEQTFVPVPADAPAAVAAAAPAAATFKFADDEPKKPDPGPKKKPAAEKPPAPKPPAPKPEEPKKPADDDDEDAESVKRGYGVIQETAEEIAEAEKNKPKFGEVQDKFKKSARGPATALLVMPSNLLIAGGFLAAVGGLFLFVWGMWPLVFNDAPPGDEETEEAILKMILGLMTFGWGAFVCFGASQMSELKSFLWAMAGAVMAVPLLVGIYAVIMLQNPKVKAGFEESEGALDEDDPDEDDGKKKGKDDDEDEDDEDDEDEDDD